MHIAQTPGLMMMMIFKNKRVIMLYVIKKHMLPNFLLYGGF